MIKKSFLAWAISLLMVSGAWATTTQTTGVLHLPIPPLGTTGTADGYGTLLQTADDNFRTYLGGSLTGKHGYALLVNPGETAFELYSLPADPLGWTHIDVIGGTGAPAHKATPIDADFVPYGNSASSNVWSYATWTEVKAFLKTYWDTLYQPKLSHGTIVSAATIYPSSDGTNTGTKAQIFTVTALASAAAFNAPVTGIGWNDGDKLIIRILDDNGGSAPYTLDFTTSTAYRFGDVPAPTTTVKNKTMYLGFIYNSVISKWDCTGSIGNF